MGAPMMMTEPAGLIAERLLAALDHHVAAEIRSLFAERGLAAGGPDQPVIALTVEEVARLAARVAAEHGALL
ncbi:MAG TPA: hypothetical protein VF657_08145 [Actinoplanes sp.]|jgi:hypothetical protein